MTNPVEVIDRLIIDLNKILEELIEKINTANICQGGRRNVHLFKM